MMMRRRWQFLVGSALSLAVSVTASAQGTPAPPDAGTPPAPAAPAQPSAPPQPGTPAPLPAPAGYPQQQPGYPPPGYPQQQPGYPPPGYPQQQPGYPPPGYPQQQPGYPPPGYPQQQPGYPPPGYPQQPGYPPPGYAYPPSYYSRPAPPPPAGKHGFLALVYLGANVLEGTTGQNENAGLRLGTIMGGRVNEQFSINGELTLDVLNPKSSSNTDVSEIEADLALSPLFHVHTGSVEIVMGPKLGVMGYDYSVGGTTMYKGHGWVYGVNAGAFASISRSVSIGGLISFVGRSFTQAQLCASDDDCSDVATPDASKVLGITGAILF